MKTNLFPGRILIACSICLFASCAEFEPFFGTQATLYMKQAFGDALRSLEGQAIVNAERDVPKMILALRDKWLPPGTYWSHFANDQLIAFLKTYRSGNVGVDAALEKLAFDLQR